MPAPTPLSPMEYAVSAARRYSETAHKETTRFYDATVRGRGVDPGQLGRATEASVALCAALKRIATLGAAR